MTMSKDKIKKVAEACRDDLKQIIVKRTGDTAEEVDRLFNEVLDEFRESECVFTRLVTQKEFLALQRTHVSNKDGSVELNAAWYVTLEVDGEVYELAAEDTAELAVRNAWDALEGKIPL